MHLVQMLMLLLVSPVLPAAAPLDSPSQAFHPPPVKDSSRPPATISEEEFAALRGRVLARCNLSPATDPAKAPWYFHYELGLELERRGDAQRALDALLAATDRRPLPRRNARMYGMWFTEYRPYFEIAKVQFALGHWQCAADALRISGGEQEVVQGETDYSDFLELQSNLIHRLH